MESKHLSSKVRSSYLITMILSYIGHYAAVKSLLRCSSKKGAKFFSQNKEQIKAFCTTYVSDVTIELTSNIVFSISPQMRYIDTLHVDTRHDFSKLRSQLANITCINNLSFVDSFNFELGDQKKEAMLRDLHWILSKAKVLDTRISEMTIYDYIALHPEVEMQAQKIILLWQKRTDEKFFQSLNKFQHLQEICIDFQNNEYIFPERLESLAKIAEGKELKLMEILGGSEGALYELFKESNLQYLKDLTSTKLLLGPGDLDSCSDVLQQLSTLKDISIIGTVFDYTLLKSWPKLRSLCLSCYELANITITDPYYLKAIKDLRITYRLKGSQEKVIDIEKQTYLEWTLRHLPSVKVVHVFELDLNSAYGLLENSFLLESFTFEKCEAISEQFFQMLTAHSRLKRVGINITQTGRTIQIEDSSIGKYYSNSMIEYVNLNLRFTYGSSDCIVSYAKFLIKFFKSLNNLKQFVLTELNFPKPYFENILLTIMKKSPNIDFTISSSDQIKCIFINKRMGETPLMFKSYRLSKENEFTNMLMMTQMLRVNKSLYTLTGVKINEIYPQELQNFFYAVEAHPRLKVLHFLTNRNPAQFQVLLNVLEPMILQSCGKINDLRIKNLFPLDLTLRGRGDEERTIKERLVENIKSKLPNMHLLIL